jgi:hypothetical protein
MKKLIALLLLVVSTFNIAFADCDFSTGIVAGPNHTWIFTDACYLKVGLLVQQNASLTTQVADYQKAIQLKDLALTTEDSRVQMWEKSSLDEQQRLTTIDADKKTSEWVFFGLGVATTFLAAYSAAKIIGK